MGTCQTAVITGFASQPLKHWSIPMIERTNPRITIASHKSLVNTLADVPTKEMPCKVEVVEKVFNISGKLCSPFSEKQQLSNLTFNREYLELKYYSIDNTSVSSYHHCRKYWPFFSIPGYFGHFQLEKWFLYSCLLSKLFWVRYCTWCSYIDYWLAN